jgi:hypothetical protein
MDRQKLLEQYQRTGNLMDVFHDHDVLREMVQTEDECGEFGIGFPAYSHNHSAVAPDQMEQSMYKVRLLSILFSEIKTMMNQANLGSGTEAAIVEARQRIHQKLDHLSTEQKSFFDALVAEELSASSTKPIRAQLRAEISSLLSAIDWNEIGQEATNALQTQLVEFIESAKSA